MSGPDRGSLSWSALVGGGESPYLAMMGLVTSLGSHHLMAIGSMMAVLWGTPSPALADGVAVLGYRGAQAPASAEATVGALRAAIGAEGVADGFARANRRLRSGAVPKAWLRDFRRAQELSDEGWRAYLGVHRSFAAGRLSAARRAAERVLALPGGVELFAEISLRLGVVVRDLGREQESSSLFRLVATLVPKRRVTSAEFSPDVVAAFAAAPRASAKPVRVTLELRGARGELSVDGGEFRKTPSEVELAPGQHVLIARSAGYRPRGQVFELIGAELAARRISVELEPEPLAAAALAGPASLAVGTGERDASLAVEGIVRYGELDSVVLVAAVWRHGGPALLGQLCIGVPVKCGAVVEIGFGQTRQLAAAARELWRTLRSGGVARGFPPTLLVDRRLVSGETGPGPVVGGGHRGNRWWRSPYLWIGVGALALGVGAAVIFNRDTTLEPIVVGEPCDFISCQ